MKSGKLPFMPATLDFQQILRKPSDAYQEGLRFFRGEGLMNQTLKQLAADLDARQIAYAVIGAVALNQHGYQRFTSDIDILLTSAGLERFRAELVGRGYRPAFEGATRKFRATAENVPIEVITSGEFPGDGRAKAVSFPDPASVAVEIDGVKTVSLEKLVELKLASGQTGLGRLRDLADVQDLIRILDLAADFSEKIDASVRDKYRELWEGVQAARAQSEAPDFRP